MVLLRLSSARVASASIRALPRTVAWTPLRSAHQSYGGGQGDPKGERPLEQGESPTTRAKEHPGPEPPAKNDSGSSSSSPSSSSSSSSGSSGSSSSSSSGKPQPRIHDKSQPQEDAAAKKHNEEFSKRHDRSNPEKDDKVDKDFWKGQGGADRQP